MKKAEKNIKKLPQKPGVYMFKNSAGWILYIGKAVNLRSRVRSHFKTLRLGRAMRDTRSGNNLLSNQFIEKVADIDWIETDDEKQAYLLENELIKKYKPRYNIQWRDDKSYFWVMFSDEEWPRVKIVHQVKLKNPPQPSLKGGGAPPLGGARGDFSGIGPFVNGRELQHLLRALRKIFPYRTCKNPYNKPCLQWHLGLCVAHNPNSKFTIQNSKLQLKIKNYFDLLNTLRQFLKIYAGESIRIEAYDISNIHGVWATGSMIVFYGNKPQKSDYRRFKIKTVAGANDVAMLREVFKRRFGHPEWPFPDLILIDGGRAQLNAAQLITENCQLPTVALAKREEEFYTEYSNKTLKLNGLPTEMKLIFQAIRNEAHHFAIFYYRHLHGKEFRNRTNSKKTRTKNQKTA